jgi:type I restriction enzyme S subunit
MNDGDKGDLSGLPSGWIQTNLAEIAQVMDTDHKMPKASDQGIFFISPKDFIDNGKIDFENAKKISEDDFARISRKCKPENGDLLFSRIGTIGKVRKVPINFKFHISYSLCIIRPNTLLRQPDFLFYLLQSPFIHEIAFSKRRSIGVPDLGLGDIKNFPVSLPPINEQRRIVARIEELFSRLDAGVEALRRARAQLPRYRQSVLQAAVTGKLTAKWRAAHPEVEPAEELLERIAKEKEAASRNKKIRRDSINDDESTILGKLPETWTWAKWEQIGLSQNGRLFPSKEYQSHGYKLLRPGNLHSSGKVVWTIENTRYLDESGKEFSILHCWTERVGNESNRSITQR